MILINSNLTRLRLGDAVKTNGIKLFNIFFDINKVGIAKKALLDKIKDKW